MGDKTKRVTVKCPACKRNVTVQACPGVTWDFWCARCQVAFLVTLDATGNVTRTKAL